MEQVEAIFYERPDGSCPVEEFLDSLEPKKRAKVARTISLLQEYGTGLRGPHSEHIEDGIFELRVKFGNNISRVLYFFFAGGKAVLTNGFTKKQQKTPAAEIARAKEYRKDFLSRI